MSLLTTKFYHGNIRECDEELRGEGTPLLLSPKQLIAMKIIGHFQERMIAPQHTDGHDWHNTGTILLIQGKKRLVWRKAGRHWSGIGMQSSHPASLDALGVKGAYNSSTVTDIIEGGRLSRKRLEGLLPKLREVLELPALSMEHLDTKKTFVVDRIEE